MINMETLQVRIDDEDIAELKELMKHLKMSKSEVARNAMAEGLRRLKMEIAMKKFIKGEFSLERAAEFSRSSIMEMAEYLTEHGVTYFRYDSKEISRDTETVSRHLKTRKKRS
jgi:predicted HTH domain antitoxin